MYDDLTNATSLAEIIRRGRERAAGDRRGKPLLRKNLAMLADVSAAYITRIEDESDQGLRRPAKDKLSRILAILAFTPAEAAHAHRLAGLASATEHAVPADNDFIDDEKIFLDQLNPSLAGIVDQYWTVLAANTAYRDTFSGLLEDQNVLRWFFLNPESRKVMVEWREEAALTVSWLRSQTANNPETPQLNKLYNELSGEPDFIKMYRNPGLVTQRHKPLMLVSGAAGTKVLNVRLFTYPMNQNLKIYLATVVD